MKAIFEYKNNGNLVTRELDLDFIIPGSEDVKCQFEVGGKTVRNSTSSNLKIKLDENTTVRSVRLKELDLSVNPNVAYYWCYLVRPPKPLGYISIC
ncbi:hypothetical protein O1B87_003435 [Vibrio cholerae]|nr:hypothetical protein [Vibrio cholerae]